MEKLQLGSSGGYVDEKGPVRQGVWKCRDCRWQFDGNDGTVFQGSKIPLSKWVTAIYLMVDSLK